MVVGEKSPIVVRWRQGRNIDQRGRVNVLEEPDAIRHVGHVVVLETPKFAIPVAPAFPDRSEEAGERLESGTRLADEAPAARSSFPRNSELRRGAFRKV